MSPDTGTCKGSEMRHVSLTARMFALSLVPIVHLSLQGKMLCTHTYPRPLRQSFMLQILSSELSQVYVVPRED